MLYTTSIINFLNIFEAHETRPSLSLHGGIVLESMLPLKLVLLAVGPVLENPFAVALLPAKVSEEMRVLKHLIV